MRHILLTAALIAAPTAVLAEGFSYSYADLRYFSTDTDVNSINQHGATLSGSLALNEMFFVAGDASYGRSERFSVGSSSGKFDTIVASARLGAHQAITPVLDLVGSAGGLYGDVSGKDGFKGNSDNDFGYIAEAGLRLAVIPQVELGAFYNYQSLFNDDRSAFTADLQFHFTEQLSFVASATNGRNADFYTVGARYHF